MKPETGADLASEQKPQKTIEQDSTTKQPDFDHIRAKEFAKTQAREINEALLRDDFSTVVQHSLPNVVKFNGGVEKMIAAMERSSREMKSSGTVIHAASVGEPDELVTQGEELFVVVPLDLELKVPNGKLRASSFVIGISNDGGKNWKFVNGDLDTQTVKLAVPNLPSKLRIPTRSQPVFERD